MSTKHVEPHGRTAVTVGALVALVAALVAVAIGLNRVAGSGSGAGIPTPTPSPKVEATPKALNCDTARFGSVLQPRDAPADVHRYAAAPAMQINTRKLYQADIHTAKGDIVLCLEPDIAPHTVNNFVALARNHFFDGLRFHRVVAGFVIQGGDPKGDGTGGPGYQFPDEIPAGTKYTAGSLAMANSGKNTNGSQFFICLPGSGASPSQCDTLPASYNLFGKVLTGLDVAVKITQGDVMESVTVREQR